MVRAAGFSHERAFCLSPSLEDEETTAGFFFFCSRGTLVEASGDDEIPTSRTAATRRWRFTLTGYAKRFAARPVEAHFHDTEDARRESFERARNPAARTRLPSRLRPELFGDSRRGGVDSARVF